MNPTPPIARLNAEIYPRFPAARTMGTYNRRKIAGSDTWSQHAWANAEDIGVGTLELGDLVYNWLAQNGKRLGLRRLGWRRRWALWRVSGHYDHLHVEGRPKQTGVPPLPGSTLPIEEDDEMGKPPAADIKAWYDAGIFGTNPNFVAYWTSVPDGDAQWRDDFWPAYYRGVVTLAAAGGGTAVHNHDGVYAPVSHPHAATTKIS